MNEITTEMARLRVEECLSYAEIGGRYGVSAQAVQQRLKAAGVVTDATSRRRQARVARLTEARDLIVANESTLKAEAERLGYANGESLRRVMLTEGLSVAGPREAADHGTERRYRKGCKCAVCRAAHAQRQRRLLGKEPPRHGTTSAYRNYGCRCRRCRAAHSKDQRKRRKK